MSATMLRSPRLDVRAGPTGKTASIKRGSSKTAVPARETTPRGVQQKRGSTTESGTSLRILKKIEELKVLSKVEKSGLLSTLEKNGLTLAKIEEAGLLSFAEESGVLSLVADEKTPGLLSTGGLALLGAAGALIYFVGDDSTSAVVGQTIGAVALAGAGIAALVGGSTLGKFQKL